MKKGGRKGGGERERDPVLGDKGFHVTVSIHALSRVFY